MVLALCIDDNGGMAFNHRRISQDRLQQERLLNISKEQNLHLSMSAYSAKLFDDAEVTVRDDFIENYDDNTLFFAECVDVTSLVEKADKIILYKWNRRYPSDLKFDFALLKDFKLIGTFDFAGSSHEKITEETYERR